MLYNCTLTLFINFVSGLILIIFNNSCLEKQEGQQYYCLFAVTDTICFVMKKNKKLHFHICETEDIKHKEVINYIQTVTDISSLVFINTGTVVVTPINPGLTLSVHLILVDTGPCCKKLLYSLNCFYHNNYQ